MKFPGQYAGYSLFGRRGGCVLPEAAVAGLAEIIGSRADLTEDDLHGVMADAPVPEPVATQRPSPPKATHVRPRVTVGTVSISPRGYRT